ncbi:MAG: hypothetical protein JSS68_09095 [Actinobacteria bacterium]|nr:hypothetical protein [Actinomycetota bacterium]MBS1883955.1 hypothetical protein [Actinomycetota bacterium]
MSSRTGTGRSQIDRSLIDELLARRVDPRHLLQQYGSWCRLYGIEPGSLRRVRENIGVASDSPLAARAGFQLGIELPESEGDPPLSSDLDFEIALFMGNLFMGKRVAAAIDEAWCERHGVSIGAVERVSDTCGRFPNPEAAAGSAFELAIEARTEVLTWRTVA